MRSCHQRGRAWLSASEETKGESAAENGPPRPLLASVARANTATLRRTRRKVPRPCGGPRKKLLLLLLSFLSLLEAAEGRGVRGDEARGEEEALLRSPRCCCCCLKGEEDDDDDDEEGSRLLRMRSMSSLLLLPPSDDEGGAAAAAAAGRGRDGRVDETASVVFVSGAIANRHFLGAATAVFGRIREAPTTSGRIDGQILATSISALSKR